MHPTPPTLINTAPVLGLHRQQRANKVDKQLVGAVVQLVRERRLLGVEQSHAPPPQTPPLRVRANVAQMGQSKESDVKHG